MITTYSFLDSVVVLSHINYPVPIVFTGEGSGSISVSHSDVRTAMEQAADGAVMVSKQVADLGTVTITVQQTSKIHKELLRLINQLVAEAPSSWAQAVLTIKNITDGTGHICTGVAFQKVPDKNYAKTGSNVTWTLMCANIANLTV